MAKQKKLETNNKQRITRRDFLKAGGAVIASVVALNSLSSCTTSETTKTEAIIIVTTPTSPPLEQHQHQSMAVL